MKLNDLHNFVYYYQELQKIARSINHLNTKECNEIFTNRDKTRLKNLELKADKVIKYINKGFKAYFQRDPRGLPVYIIDKTCNDYTDGIPILLK